jgi:hypothetical protein
VFPAAAGKWSCLIRTLLITGRLLLLVKSSDYNAGRVLTIHNSAAKLQSYGELVSNALAFVFALSSSMCSTDTLPSFTYGLVNVTAFRLILDLRDVGTQARSHVTPPSAYEMSSKTPRDTYYYRKYQFTGSSLGSTLLAPPTPAASYQTQAPHPFSMGVPDDDSIKLDLGDSITQFMGARGKEAYELQQRSPTIGTKSTRNDIEANLGPNSPTTPGSLPQRFSKEYAQ